jgi:acetyl/propionyl-CoA carboxylase alpha subunit
MTYEIQIGERVARLKLERGEGGGWTILLDGEPLAADIASPTCDTLSLLIAGRSYSFAWARGGGNGGGAIWLAGGGRSAEIGVRDPRQAQARHQVQLAGRARLHAPMAGKVVKLLAAPGAVLEAGQGVVVLEAMKMQNEVRSPKAGTLLSLAVAAGDTVATGALLAEVE